MRTLFENWKTFATENVVQALDPRDVVTALHRHGMGDWGDIDRDGWKQNEISAQEGSQLFSVYHTPEGRKFWIITDISRQMTTILLPDEYSDLCPLH